MRPAKLGVEIDLDSWTIPPVYELLRRIGDIRADDLRRTFNLNIGMILAVSQKDRAKAEGVLRRMREPYFAIGRVVTNKPKRPRVED
jgi:phosphoribosylformylglycinamidine cyclo-ligase